MRSCGVNFEKSEIFKFLRGPNGWFPKKLQILFAKNYITRYMKSQLIKLHVFMAKNTIISDIVGNRVNLDTQCKFLKLP